MRTNSISAFVVTIGEPTLDACVSALKRQSLPLDRIELISNVQGIHNAANRVHQLANEDYFLKVDADMILYPNCVESLYKRISKRSNIAQASGMLKDDLQGDIWGINMYNTKLIKPFCYPDSIGSDVAIKQFRDSHGYETVALDNVLGEHKPYHDFDSIFHKFEREGQKIVHYKDPARLAARIRYLSELIKAGDTRALIALNAITVGMIRDDKRQKDFTKYGQTEEFRKLKEVYESNIDLLKVEDSLLKQERAGRMDRKILHKIKRFLEKIGDINA